MTMIGRTWEDLARATEREHSALEIVERINTPLKSDLCFHDNLSQPAIMDGRRAYHWLVSRGAHLPQIYTVRIVDCLLCAAPGGGIR
jgi:hypothetical protein